MIINDQVRQLEFDHMPHVQQPMIDQVVKHFLNKGANPCSAKEAVQVMTMIDKITGKI